MGNSALITKVLEASERCASDMTQALCTLGNGKMGAGIVALWNAGQKKGMIKGICITSFVFSGVILFCRYRENKSNQVEFETVDTCSDLQHPFVKNGAENLHQFTGNR